MRQKILGVAQVGWVAVGIGALLWTILPMVRWVWPSDTVTLATVVRLELLAFSCTPIYLSHQWRNENPFF